MHFYQFHIGDYKSHTHHLSVIEDLAYRRLLDHYYLHEAPIRQRDIARQIGMRDHEQEVLTVLDEFFVSTEQGYINPRADEEISKYRKFSEDGKKGAAKRWHKGSNGEANSPPNATPIATNNQEPITNNQRKRSPKVEQTLDEYLAACKEAGKKPVPEDHPVRAYAEDAGIDMDMLAINWLVFKDRHLGTPKVYKDWPAAFSNSVKSRWYNIWFSDGDEMKWTSTGLQEKKVYDSRMKEASHG
jgi:uncharacterized protein YdaU (DUF1376 family)